MRIKLDRTLCDGFGVCAKHAPEHFSLDDWGYASLVGAGDVQPGDADDVRRALLDCPVHAIVELSSFRPTPADGVQPAETCEVEKSSLPPARE